MPQLLAGLRELAVAAGLGREVDDDGARLHRLDHFPRDEHRCGTAGNGGGRDHRIGSRYVRPDQLPLALQEVLAGLPRVTAGTFL